MDQLAAVGLVEMVTEGGGDQLFIALLQGAEQHRQVAAVADSVAIGDGLGQHGACLMGGELEIGGQGHEPQLGMGLIADGIDLLPIHHGGGQTAQQGRGKVIGVAFNDGGDLQQLFTAEGRPRHQIGSHGAACDQRGGRAETAADGNIGLNVDMDRGNSFAQLLPHGGEGYIGQIVLVPKLLGAARKAQFFRRGEAQLII